MRYFLPLASALVPLIIFAVIAWVASRRAAGLEDAIDTHFALRHGKSRTREDYQLWRRAGKPTRCLVCGQVNFDFLECDNPQCGAKQPFDDVPAAEKT